MKTKMVKYEIEWANGEKEIVKIPAFFQPSQVKKNLPYSEVVMLLEKGYHVFANSDGRIDGPARVAVLDNGELTPAFKHL